MSTARLTPASFRDRFPIFRDRVYLNSCSQGALSLDVDAAIRAWLDSWRTKGSPWDEWVEQVEALRQAFARHVGADAGEVAVLPSASVAAGVIASAMRWDDGRPAVVASAFEFPTMGHVWLAQQGRGAEIRWARPRHGDLPLPAFDAVIDERTRLVATTHVCYRNGYRVDVAGLARVCRTRGALLLVDDYQCTGTRPLDVRRLGVDMLVTGALKYLLGPAGVAFLFVRRDVIAQLEPAVTGWFGRAQPFAFNAEVLDWADDAHRLENGTPPIPNVYGALAGLDLLERAGAETVDRQISHLTAVFLDAARGHGWSVLTPIDAAHRGPLCVIRSGNASELARRLGARGIMVSARGDGLRVSFHAYNNDDDIAAIVEALCEESAMIERDS